LPCEDTHETTLTFNYQCAKAAPLLLWIRQAHLQINTHHQFTKKQNGRPAYRNQSPFARHA